MMSEHQNTDLMYSVHFETNDGDDVKALVGSTVQRYHTNNREQSLVTGVRSVAAPSLSTTPVSPSAMSTTPVYPKKMVDDDSDEDDTERLETRTNSDVFSKDSRGGNLSLYVTTLTGDTHRHASESRLTNSDFDDEDVKGEEDDALPPLKSFGGRVDVLDDGKNSWAGVTLSMIMKDDSVSSRGGEEMPAKPEEPPTKSEDAPSRREVLPQSEPESHRWREKKKLREDVLEGKGSWGRANVSSMFEVDSTSFNVTPAPFEDLNPRVSFHSTDELSV